MGATGDGTRRVAVIGPDAGACRAFAETVAGRAEEGTPLTFTLDGGAVVVSLAAADRPHGPPRVASIDRLDLVVLVLRHLDRLSLEAAAACFEASRAAPTPGIGIVILRDPGADAFKISCPACGHRMWVPYDEVGRRGRCTRCERPMSVPGPVEHVRRALSLPDAAPVLHAVARDGSICRGALSNLLARAASASAAALGETTVIDPPRPKKTRPGTTGPGSKSKGLGPRRTVRIVRR